MAVDDHSVERRLVAIVAADVAGYSRLMGKDEAATLARLASHRSILDARIVRHRGRIANTAGDSVLAEFPSAVDAVRCAIAAQEELAVANNALAEAERLAFRVGIHVGDVMVREGDLFGDGVNVAARLQALAEPGGICLSGAAHDLVRKAVPIGYIDLGAQTVKNIVEPVRTFAVRVTGAIGSASASKFRIMPPLPDRPSLAVLPFTNVSGDPDQEYFSDGITEDIITALSRVKWFFVIARNSSFIYKGKAVDVRQVGRELGVRYVLEGSVRRAGKMLRITAQLVEAENAHHVWADKFDGVLDDVFALQDRITICIAGAIEPSVQLAEIERSRIKPTEDLNAYDLVLRTLPNTYLDTSRDLNSQAISLLERAVAHDPSYVQALGLLVLTYGFRRGNDWATTHEIQRALALADEVARRATDDPISLSCAGAAIAFLPEGRPSEGLALTERAYSQHPNSVRIILNSGMANLYNGNPEKAIERLQQAHRVSPIDPGTKLVHALCGLAYILLERNEEALSAGLMALSETPLWGAGRRVVIASLANLGRLEEAQSEVARLLALQPEISLKAIRKTGMGAADKRFGNIYTRALLRAGYPD